MLIVLPQVTVPGFTLAHWGIGLQYHVSSCPVDIQISPGVVMQSGW